MEIPYFTAHWKLQDVSCGLEFDPHEDFEFLSDTQREEMNQEYAGIYENEVNKILSRYKAIMLSNGDVICGNDSPIGLDMDVDDKIREEISEIDLDVNHEFFTKWSMINASQE